MAKQGRDPSAFLSTIGARQQMMSFRKGQTIFGQGDTADAIFVILKGNVRLSARSRDREATLDILSDEDFVGEDCIAGERLRTASASAMTDCTLLRIQKKTMILTLAQEPKLSNMFCAYVLARKIRYQQDLVDQRCNRSEKRLARILLLLAHFDGRTSPEGVVPNISHKMLAEMVGTTRSRVSFFMKRFRDSGLIDYKLHTQPIRIRRSLLAFQAP
jgi:CRP/FNR family cyclic AMP-dependent transcriptional regulator